MNNGTFVIPKKQVPVTLWVHPEGRVQGAMYVRVPENSSMPEEQPSDVINEIADFVVIEREDPNELRFYNKSSIVRVQYQEQVPAPPHEGQRQPCRITMMDGSLIEAEIWKVSPAGRSRLYDLMNDTSERFLKLRTSRAEVLLINKSYVVYISEIEVCEQSAYTVDSETASGQSLELMAVKQQ